MGAGLESKIAKGLEVEWQLGLTFGQHLTLDGTILMPTDYLYLYQHSPGVFGALGSSVTALQHLFSSNSSQAFAVCEGRGSSSKLNDKTGVACASRYP